MNETPVGRLTQRTELYHGRFRIDLLLASAPQRAVYRVWDTKRARAATLLEFATADATHAAAALERAAPLVQLDHPVLAAFQVVFVEQDTVFLVLQLPGGQTIDHIMAERQAPITPNAALRWIAQAAETLDVLQQALPAWHFGDVSAGALLVTAEDRVQVLSFEAPLGLQTPEQIATHVPTGMVAPELQAGLCDARSDVFALAATLHYLLTRRVWLNGATVSEASLAELRPDLPRPLIAAMVRGLAADPVERWATVGDFYRALIATLPTTHAGNDWWLAPANPLEELTAEPPTLISQRDQLRAAVAVGESQAAAELAPPYDTVTEAAPATEPPPPEPSLTDLALVDHTTAAVAPIVMEVTSELATPPVAAAVAPVATQAMPLFADAQPLSANDIPPETTPGDLLDITAIELSAPETPPAVGSFPEVAPAVEGATEPEDTHMAPARDASAPPEAIAVAALPLATLFTFNADDEGPVAPAEIAPETPPAQLVAGADEVMEPAQDAPAATSVMHTSTATELTESAPMEDPPAPPTLASADPATPPAENPVVAPQLIVAHPDRDLAPEAIPFPAKKQTGWLERVSGWLGVTPGRPSIRATATVIVPRQMYANHSYPLLVRLHVPPELAQQAQSRALTAQVEVEYYPIEAFYTPVRRLALHIPLEGGASEGTITITAQRPSGEGLADRLVCTIRTVDGESLHPGRHFVAEITILPSQLASSGEAMITLVHTLDLPTTERV
jgi:hypothetical protein